jgi:hydroxymethylbilane synthase
MSNKTKYKIGTRGSLLAVTQCTLIANEMSDITGSEFELVKISTQGDQQTEKPLWQMDGKDFFTKELDSALLANEVDLVVLIKILEAIGQKALV